MNFEDTNCQQCGLYKHSKHPRIWGKGNSLNPKLVLIGEAPGPDEAEQGQVFIGRAGKKLDRMLDGHYIRDTIYITNIVKCFPPETMSKPTNRFRAPTQMEVKLCKPALVSEILMMTSQPILMPLGNVALAGLTGSTRSITKALGKEIKISIGPVQHLVIPNYHPSYILRTPSKEQVFVGVLKYALSLL